MNWETDLKYEEKHVLKGNNYKCKLMIQRSVGLRNEGVVKGGKREEKCGKRDLWVERV